MNAKTFECRTAELLFPFLIFEAGRQWSQTSPLYRRLSVCERSVLVLEPLLSLSTHLTTPLSSNIKTALAARASRAFVSLYYYVLRAAQ